MRIHIGIHLACLLFIVVRCQAAPQGTKPEPAPVAAADRGNSVTADAQKPKQPAIDPKTMPLKIYILAGQSNMQGLGTIAPANTPGTLEYTVANDPDKAYQFLVDADGRWVVRDDVRIRYISKHGGLTPGYGGGHDAEPKYIGPEP